MHLLEHLDASSLFIQLLLLVFHLGLQVTKLLFDLGQRGLILGLLGGQILQLYLQLLYFHVHRAQFIVLVLQAGEIERGGHLEGSEARHMKKERRAADLQLLTEVQHLIGQ